MSNNRILLNLQEFRALANRHADATNALSGLRHNTDKGALRLSSVDTLEQCLRGLNESLTELQAITRAEVQSVKTLESQFIETDRSLQQMFDRR
ncbi:MAG: hypothetical protein FWE48_06630 [Coriobacteriia bacterium]|nr:hypothetical protein [Coriobacteriia bacterium]